MELINKSFKVTEGICGIFSYHLSHPHVSHFLSLCGAQVMPTRIPIEAWGTKTELNEKYCSDCYKKAEDAKKGIY